MSANPMTFELRISCLGSKPAATKKKIKNWLASKGETQYVEGFLDNMDIDFEYALNARDYYSEMGGDQTPIILYKFDEEWIHQLSRDIQAAFGNKIAVTVGEMATESWQDGWRDGFLPIRTQRFFIYPPWWLGPLQQEPQPLMIEPAMAFGTGQHATTLMCLELVETLQPGGFILDIGAGTGILAVAAKLLGWANVLATDIDPDAVLAARHNAALNQVYISLWDETYPLTHNVSFACVVANILGVVLREHIHRIAPLVAPGGNLILSGILEEEAAEMQRLSEKHGLTYVQTTYQDGWAALQMARGLA